MDYFSVTLGFFLYTNHEEQVPRDAGDTCGAEWCNSSIIDEPPPMTKGVLFATAFFFLCCGRNVWCRSVGTKRATMMLTGAGETDDRNIHRRESH